MHTEYQERMHLMLGLVTTMVAIGSHHTFLHDMCTHTLVCVFGWIIWIIYMLWITLQSRVSSVIYMLLLVALINYKFIRTHTLNKYDVKK